MADDAAEDQQLRKVIGDVYPDVLRVAFNQTRNLADAEDVAQDACLRAWEARARYFRHKDARVIGWLVKVAKRIVIDRSRRRQADLRRAEGALPLEEVRLSIPDGAAALTRARALRLSRTIIDELDEVDRAFLGVWAEQRKRDITRDGAATELDMTIAEYEAAKKRLRRSAKTIAKRLGVDAAGVLLDAPDGSHT